MEVFDALFTRRSIRRYSEKKVDDASVDKILWAAMYAPSAVNNQPWHFIVFDDRNTYASILEVHPNAGALAEAQKAILVCYDRTLQHDEGYGVIDCSAATQNILLAAHAIGIGSCWIGICPRQNRMEVMQKIFDLPEKIIPFALISLGYPAESKSQPNRFNPDRIHHANW
jgi:nitroreductase